MTRKYKRLEELEIWDDFMFGAVMSNKELCKHLLEIILQKKIRDIRYTELQKTIDLQYDAKSIQLDVYVEDDLDSVYNIEIQTTNEKNLPKRSNPGSCITPVLSAASSQKHSTPLSFSALL